MQHETKMENQSWLKKLARRLGPGHIVNLCFIVVLLFSTLLTWREVVVLEDAYISSQRNHLENVANALDKHLQYNVDKLIFLRNGMREALVAPLDFTSLRNAVTEFEQHRDEHACHCNELCRTYMLLTIRRITYQERSNMLVKSAHSRVNAMLILPKSPRTPSLSVWTRTSTPSKWSRRSQLT